MLGDTYVVVVVEEKGREGYEIDVSDILLSYVERLIREGHFFLKVHFEDYVAIFF